MGNMTFELFGQLIFMENSDYQPKTSNFKLKFWPKIIMLAKN